MERNYAREEEQLLFTLYATFEKYPKGANKKDIWERVIVPSVMRKYQHMKYNLNNYIKSLYMSMTKCMCESTFTLLVNCTDIYTSSLE